MFSLFFISYGLQFISFIISAFADVPRKESQQLPHGLHKKSPEEDASFLNKLLFSWFDRMVYLGYKKRLEMEDLWELKAKDKADAVSRAFEWNWKAEKVMSRRNGGGRNVVRKASNSSQILDVRPEKKPSLLKAMINTYYAALLHGANYKVIHVVLSFASPQILKLMISFTTDLSIPEWRGYFYAVLMMASAILQSLLLQQYFHHSLGLGMNIHTTIMGAVYKKALVMSSAAHRASTMGEVVNLMSTDAQHFMDVAANIQLIWASPLQIILALIFLWIELGPSVLAGLAVMILLIPINALLANKSRGFQVKNMEIKDERIKMMNEILNGIKILKLYAWEPSFGEQVTSVRNAELDVMRSYNYLNSVSIFFFTCAPFLVSLASFGVYLAVDPNNILDAQKAFTSISLFNILRFPLAVLPIIISYLVQASVSLNRLESFLNNSELDQHAVGKEPSEGVAVELHDASFSWNDDEIPILKKLNVQIKEGSLLAVVGKVGAGKSSLLAAMLGEMERINGSVDIRGSIAYVPQQAWIQNASLRDNVLFGATLESVRYWRVLEACALLPDLDTLPARDLTEIGEKGINLSGGQKQRVSLARAIYSQADVFLFDDALSAVDSHVGLHIFQQVLGPKGLLQNKTRLLVTHGLSFLPQVDCILVMTEGLLSEIGTYQQLLQNGEAFAEFLQIYSREQDNEGSEDEEQDDEETNSGKMKNGHLLKRLRSVSSTESSKSKSRKKSLSKDVAGHKTNVAGQKLIEKETMDIGNVKLTMYTKYFRAWGWTFSIMVLIGMAGQSAATLGQNLWLSDWTSESMNNSNSNLGLRLGVYTALGLAQGLFVVLSTVSIVVAAIHASSILHSSLLENILRLPQTFFDTTPIGRIVNRFSKDMDTIDQVIPVALRSWLSCAFGVLSTIVAITIATPIFLAVAVPIATFYFFVQRFYVATSRQLRRLDSVTRSPIYSHLGETLSGLPVIRAYGHADRFLEHNRKIVDTNLLSVYLWIVANRWLAIRLELVGTLFVFFAMLFAVLSRQSLMGGIVGLSISYALNVTQTLNWLVRETSELETNIVAVERVVEYSQAETEAPWVLENRPSPGWPQHGRITFENYCLRYRPELELILQDISCQIYPGEKVGVVGRTGAGKSSVMNGLFRILEAAAGRILIDGIDISSIGLHDLRKQLTIIPQEPVLFSGSLRMNLDPRGQYSSIQLWHALEMAHLHHQVQEMPGGLDCPISEGGDNLSVGQRQLVCLARALLRRSRILLLDEATAAVDLETDSLIQETIRNEFVTSTVITIAHRLHTVLDYSRILVLDRGRIMEFDTPENLMERQGLFFNMAKDAGIAVIHSTAF
uniref:ATP-binding cassette sub-family C member 2-like n=1 Tax=Myxine glutinosa TaxID=7769 RepID=UPI00358E52C2